MADEEDWRRAADAVEARMSELRLDRTALAKAAGVDRKTVDNFLDRGMKPRTDKRGGYEAALGWRHGRLLGIARGAAVGPSPDDATQYVPDAGTGDSAGGLSDEAVLALIRENRRLADELERRIKGGS